MTPPIKLEGLKVQQWAVCALEYGDLSGLNDEEVAHVQYIEADADAICRQYGGHHWHWHWESADGETLADWDEPSWPMSTTHDMCVSATLVGYGYEPAPVRNVTAAEVA